MSKFLALVCAGVAGAATVSVHEHFATNDPHVMLESMRAFAKQAQQGKIPQGTFDVVAGFVSNITSSLMTSMEECVQIEDRFVTSVRATLTELNSKLGDDVSDVDGEQEGIETMIANVVAPGREQEKEVDEQRTADCGALCVELAANQPCTPPATGSWLNDAEPCCDTETDQADVPAPLRSQQWRDLENYMDCLNEFVIGDGATTSAFDLYDVSQADCINASETWEAKKEQIDPSDGSVANDLCTMISNDEDKCTHYFTNWNLQMGNLTNAQDHSSLPGRLAIAKELVENTYQQYEALRKIICLFDAIKSGGGGGDIAAACAACENQEPVCTDMCAETYSGQATHDLSCPSELKCATCCLPHVVEQECEQRHKCDVCTDKFRHEFYNCPAAEWNNTDVLCTPAPGGNGYAVVAGTGSEPAAECKLLIRQLGCTDFNCKDVCDGLDEGAAAGAGYIPASQGKPARRAYEPFTCGGEDIGNWNFGGF